MSGEDESVDRDAAGDGSDLDTRPSCSNGRRRPPSKRNNKDNNNAEKRRLVMRVKYIDATSEEDSTDADEIHESSKGIIDSKKFIQIIEGEKLNSNLLSSDVQTNIQDVSSDDSCQSDSSNNEAAEKCPICLRSFREQEIGTPAPCEHIYCAACIEAWSKNTSTCPIDRLYFESILVDRSYLNRERVRVIDVNSAAPNKSNPEGYTDDLSYCAICYEADREEVMLLCDCCNQGYHMDCLTPPMHEVPEGQWFCEHCYEDGSVEDRNLHSPNINELFEELDAELGVLVNQVSELRAPRIMRTLQNERIRSRVLNDIRQNRTRRVKRRRRRRRGSARTYEVEYEVNDFDNKFALKTNKKVIRRKRRRRVKTNSRKSNSDTRTRLAEQLGLPPPGRGRDTSNSGGSTALSLFGNGNELYYFSDDEQELTNEASEIPAPGAGAVVQTRVRLARYGVGSTIDKKSLFLESQRPRTPPTVLEPVDLLGTIMDLQDRWHTATQRIQDVHINRDGTLALPSATTTTTAAVTSTKGTTVESDKKPTIMEAPMYQRGGNTNFNRGAGNRGNASGNYNNRFGNNYNNNSNHYRNAGQNSSAGSGGNADSGDSTGDYNMNRSHLFSPGLTRLPPPPSQQNMQNNSPFSMRFNQRNQSQQQQQQQQHRHSLPFSTPRLPNYNFNSTQSRIQPLFPQQQQQSAQQQQQQQHNMSVPDLFGGLPPPTTSMESPLNPLFSGLPPPIQQHQSQQASNFPHIISVPPSPTPPSGGNFAWGPPTAPPSTVFGPVSRAEANFDDAERNQSECPNYAVYTTFSKDNLKTTHKNESEKDKENEENQEDDEKEEDLVQLDDDDEDAIDGDGGGSSENLANENIPLPPTEEIDNNNAYEPENPTEEDDEKEEEEQQQGEDDLVAQQQVDEQTDEEVENRNKSDEELKTVALKTADDGDDDGDDSSDSESDTDKKSDNIEKSNSNNNNNNSKSPKNKQNEGVEKITNNRKGVLELYDDSDWEELELEKPKDATTTNTPDAAVDNPVDRSYTPCLDEPIENEIENVSVSVSEAELETTTKVAGAVSAETNALQTELISDEEIHTRPAHKLRGTLSKTRSRSKSRPKARESRRSRSARRASAERFKKVSNRQKERNYRGITDQKQQNRRGARNERRRSFVSRSRSRSPKHTQRYRSRTRSRSLRRQQTRRSRSRSPIMQHHRFSRSPPRKRSRSRSRTRTPNRRGRAFRSRSRALRSRSRSIHNKENTRQKNSNNNHGRRNEEKSHNNNNNNNNTNNSNNNRPKRRELPRYDVRNVISNQQNPRFAKDRYGRDASRPRTRSGSRERAFVRARSFSRPPRSRTLSRTPTPIQQRPQRVRRASFSMSPTPTPPPLHYGQPSMTRQISMSPLMHYQTPPVGVRYVSPSPMQARINGGRKLPRDHSPSLPPPALQHMQRSRTPSLLRLQQVNSFPPRKSRSLSVVAAERLRSKKKKSKERKKKRSDKKVRDNSLMHVKSPNKADFEVEKALKKKRRHATTSKHWSPNSPRATPIINELATAHEAIGWTPPPRDGERLLMEVRRSLSVESANQLDKHKRQKKKQKIKEKRKEKRRTRRTASNEPQPSKEVFASGNNILVSVSFNKESNTASNALNSSSSSMPQTTVVTLPAHREDILDKRRRITYDNGKKQRENSAENSNALSMCKKRDKSNRRRTKTDAKPVAIIDLERSPFQVQQDLMDVIVLTDSEDANEKDTAKSQQRQSLLSTSAGEEEQPKQQQQPQQQQKPADKPAVESLDENYEQNQTTTANVLSSSLLTGPKTPPEPHVVKFNIQNKKTINARSALHEEVSDGMSEDEQPTCREEISSNTPLNEQPTSSAKMVATDNVITEAVVAQKIGPNTPPESAPCSPDAYDPFEPTKSPSISPSSPTPSNSAQTTINDISAENVTVNVNVDLTSKNAEQPQQQLVSSTNSGSVSSHVTNTAATQTSLNAADLVLAFINNKSSNPSNDATHIPGVGDDVISNNNNNKHDVATDGLQVLSNVLLSSPVGASLLGLGNKLTQLPALGGSVGSSSSGMLATGAGGQNISANNNNSSSLLDDSFNITDFDSPYSPGSADYEDLFEPPPDSNKHRGGGSGGGVGAAAAPAGNASKRGKVDVFDNLFGSSSPPPRHPIPNVFSAGSQRKPGNFPVKSKSSRSKGGFYK